MAKSTSLVRVLLLSFVVAVGITVAWGMVVAWTSGVVQQATMAHGQYETLQVRIDGVPVITRYAAGIYPAGMQVLTLDGEPTDSEYQYLQYPTYLAGPQEMPRFVEAAWIARLAAANDGRMPATYWYLVHDGRTNGLAYGIGYHSMSRMVVGYFGRKGFSEQMPPRDEWFQVAGQQAMTNATPNIARSEPNWTDEQFLFVLADGKLWSIDLAEREVEPLIDCPGALAVNWTWRMKDRLPKREPGAPARAATAWAERKLLVREAESVTIVDYRTGQQASYPLPASMRKSMFAGFELADDTLLLVSYQTSESQRQDIMWVDPQGEIVKQRQVRLAQFARFPAGMAQTASLVAIAAPMPLASGLTTLLLPMNLLESGQADSYLVALRRTLGETWPTILVVLAIGGIAAVAAYRRQRRYELPHAIGWAVFALVLGLPGWLAYRIHRTWPAVEDCPACKQPAPRDRADCTECGAAFPPPPLKGIEVYA